MGRPSILIYIYIGRITIIFRYLINNPPAPTVRHRSVDQSICRPSSSEVKVHGYMFLLRAWASDVIKCESAVYIYIYTLWPFRLSVIGLRELGQKRQRQHNNMIYWGSSSNREYQSFSIKDSDWDNLSPIKYNEYMLGVNFCPFSLI